MTTTKMKLGVGESREVVITTSGGSVVRFVIDDHGDHVAQYLVHIDDVYVPFSTCDRKWQPVEHIVEIKKEVV